MGRRIPYRAPMRFSVWPNSAHSPHETIAIARWADAAGWYGVWYADHYMPNTGDESYKPGDVHECWAVLPALAASTEHVRIGSLVAPTSVHHPALLANRAATIDHISNGRMVLGIGAGWQINEHRAYGIALDAAGPRVSRFEEAIQIIRALLSQDRTEFHGTYYDITDAPCDPKPVQSPLPLLVGTGSPRMSRITARFADEWNTWGHVAEATARRARFVEACEQVDRDVRAMHTSVQALVTVTDGEVAPPPPAMADRVIAGSAAYVIEQLGALAELGFDEFILPNFNHGATPAERQDTLERFASEIAPHVR